MLTEADWKWLETRLQNLKVSGWFSCTEGELIPLVNFHRKYLTSDWQDAAEFEARVNVILADGVESCEHCPAIGWCDFPACEESRLKYARLVVEQEME